MKKRSVFASISAVLILAAACAACSPADRAPAAGVGADNTAPAASDITGPAAGPAGQGTAQEDMPASNENDATYISMMSDRLKGYDSIEDLDAKADAVFTGECVSAEPVFQNMTLYTLSKIKVEEVFRGDISKGDILSFVEYGGRVTNSEYTKGCEIPEKEFAKNAPGMPGNQKLVVGLDGFFPCRENETMLVFAEDVGKFLDGFDVPLYGFIGGYDGKLFPREDGSYAKPLSGKTDKRVFGEGSLVITLDELKSRYK